MSLAPITMTTLVVGILVDLVHLLDDVVRDVGLRQQHVHVPRQPPRDRMDRVAHLDPLFDQQRRDLFDRVLGLGDRHAVTGHDDHAARRQQQIGHLVDGGLVDLAGRRVAAAGRFGFGAAVRPEAAQDHVPDRTTPSYPSLAI